MTLRYDAIGEVFREQEPDKRTAAQQAADVRAARAATFATDSWRLQDRGVASYWTRGSADDHHAIRIRLNREKTARRNDSRIGQHTRDCRRPGVRESYARAHEGRS